ncbi:uncharacterized protein LOC131597410 [Vicia villosa]|uniref:uncharacterized protein LOC131597410 n=1 Tax=Vicia villosa TaxID=3911 RepID=UPI00273B8657|nr:uncharacterized protein LOC131597410 [Vicia villosa]
MSQHSTTSSSETSTGEEPMSALSYRAQPTNISIDYAFIAAPLTTTYNADLGLKEFQTSPATRSEGPSAGYYSNPALDKIKEGSRYVDRVINRLVNRVLREDIPVVVVGRVKYWGKVNVASKKRKSRAEAESNDDVGDVQDITLIKKIVSSQSSVKFPDAPMDNISFHSIDNVDRWRFEYQRRISLERELGQDALKIKEIMDLISADGLIKFFVEFAISYERMVKEFVVNILVDCTVPGSQNFRKVYVRGKRVNFSPAVINMYLGRSGDEGCGLEGTDNQVPTNYTSTVAVGLGKFLYNVGIKNSFDYGTYIIDQTVRHAATNATKLPISFPSLICGIILNQHLGILVSTDVACKRKSAMSLHERLFAGKHVADIVLASVEKKLSTKIDVVLGLKETCRYLDEIIATSNKRKFDTELLIKGLEHPAGTGIGNVTEGASVAYEFDDHAKGRTYEETAIDNDNASSSGSNEED